MNEVTSPRRADWRPLPRPGCHGVAGKPLPAAPDTTLYLLHFGMFATTDEQAEPTDVDVFCLDGRGFASSGGNHAFLGAGQRLRLPAGSPHRLWTEDSRMIVLIAQRRAR